MAAGVVRKDEVLPNPDPSLITTEQIDKAVANLESRVMTRVDGMEKAIEVFHADLVRVPTLLDRSILGLRELLEARMNGQDAHVVRLQEQLDHKLDSRQTVVDAATDHVLTLVEEKIDGRISERISGRIDLLAEKIKSLSDVTTQQFKSIVDTFAEKDKAVSVGLSAQKESAAAQQASNTEATNKMESNFTKLLDQGRELLAEVRRNTELQINDLKLGVGSLAARLDKGEGRTSGITEADVNRARNSGLIFGLVGMVVAVVTLAILAFRVVT